MSPSISLSPSLRVSGSSLPDAQRASAKTGTHADNAINSPLLFERYNKIDPEQKHFVLDIAQANNDSLNFFEQYHCKLYLNNGINEVNRFRATVNSNDSEADEDLATSWENHLPSLMNLQAITPHKLDMVLLWGLVNYLSEAEVRTLVQSLQPYCTKNAFLHLYIFTTETMAPAPINYHISASKKVLLQSPTNQSTIPCPGYNLKQLQAMLDPFSLEHSVMLSSGIHEYLFQLS